MAAVACNSSHRTTHDDDLDSIRHDETNGDRTSDY